VLLIGALFGAKRGAATVMTYLALGIMGSVSPLRHRTGSPDESDRRLPRRICRRRLGDGNASERGWDRRTWSTALAMTIASGVIFACGVLWLGRFVGWSHAAAGFLPFIPGDLVKIALATAMLPAGWKLIGSKWEIRTADTRRRQMAGGGHGLRRVARHHRQESPDATPRFSRSHLALVRSIIGGLSPEIHHDTARSHHLRHVLWTD
jgi:biotin transport system substrate-specific component